MEKAGKWVAIVAQNALPEKSRKRVVVICGKGNNGGDGFVAARLLKKNDISVETILVGKPDLLKGDALLNFRRMHENNIQWSEYTGTIPNADLYIDALLGTGISGTVDGEIADTIEKINTAKSSGAKIIAVDIPSGINGNDGTVCGVAVKADITVTFGFAKLGHFIHPGKMHTGRLYICDIGLDKRAAQEIEITHEISTIQEITLLLPYRPADGHKGTFGKGLIISGSQGMTGAAIMASLSFLRSGAGLCYAAVPRSLVDVVDIGAREVVVLAMPEVRKKRCHSLRALGDLHRYANDVDVVAIGPGIGRNAETAEMVRRFLVRAKKPCVIDADALNALAGHINDIIPQITTATVMTPHYAELSRLLDLSIEDIERKRFNNAIDWAKSLFTTLLIKGNPTIIAQPQKPVWMNATGNDGMATAGSGDVLTGLIAGFVAQGLPVWDATRLGAYVHGLSGDIAAKYLTKRAFIAGDMIDYIPHAFLALEKCPSPESVYSHIIGKYFQSIDLGANMIYLYS